MKSNKLKIILIITSTLLAISISIIVFLYIFRPYNIILIDKDITMEVNTPYNEPGYIVTKLNNKPFHLEVINNIDNTKIGEYEITYKIGNYKKIRKVNVVDTTKPVITILKDNPMYICPDGKIKDYGATASDNYDKDLTNKIKTTVKEDEIIYEVSDSSENKTTLSRKIIRKDITKPVIKLDKNITIKKGSTFKDVYTANDNCDGNITDKVIKTGNVNTNKVGTYEITYKVKDKSNNEVSITRKVKVIDNTIKGKGKTIYLTFDDGPSIENTPDILDILKKHNIKATFFVINHNKNTDYLLKREYDEGHAIGYHSYTHNYSKIYKTDTAYFEDLNKIKNKVKNVIGIETNLIRFPGGSSNTISKSYNKGIMTRLTKSVTEKGYIYFDWNVGSSDTTLKDSKKICNQVTKSLIYKENVVLMHDSSDKIYNSEALSCIIKYGMENGYEFSKLDNNSNTAHHYVNN